MVFTPGGKVLSIGPGTSWSYWMPMRRAQCDIDTAYWLDDRGRIFVKSTWRTRVDHRYIVSVVGAFDHGVSFCFPPPLCAFRRCASFIFGRRDRQFPTGAILSSRYLPRLNSQPTMAPSPSQLIWMICPLMQYDESQSMKASLSSHFPTLSSSMGQNSTKMYSSASISMESIGVCLSPESHRRYFFPLLERFQSRYPCSLVPR